MNKKLILSAFTVLFLVGCSPKIYPVGKFQSSPIVIDGNAIDWELPLRFVSEKEGLRYSITNDNENIYVCVASDFMPTQMRMLRAGISIYVDIKGQEGKSMGVNFPFMDRNQQSNLRKGNANNENIKKLALTESNRYKSFGFLNNANGVYELAEINPIKMGVNYDINDILIIESKIPIKLFHDKELNAQNAPNISVGVELNSLTGGQASRGGQMGGGGGGMRGGGGGMSRGGVGGGMRGANFSGGPGISEPMINWYPFKLAIK
jgi:uncharacterized membrane protein YgcG